MTGTGAIEPDRTASSFLVALWLVLFPAGFAYFLAVEIPTGTVLLATLAVGLLLMIIAVIDERAFLIPDPLVVALGLTAAAFHLWHDHSALAGFLAAGLSGFGLFWLIDECYRRLRGRSGIGLGDAKLLGAAGILVGANGILSTLVWATTSALAWCVLLILAGRLGAIPTARIPFGSHIAFATWLVWLWGPLFAI